MAIVLAALAATARGEPSEVGAPRAADEAPAPVRSAATPVGSAMPAAEGGAEPYLPPGPLYFSAVQRPGAQPYPPACSFRQPVCVHARPGLTPRAVLGTLAELERASAFFFDALGLPPPLGDGRSGGSPAFDLYLVAPSSPELDGAPVLTARDDPDAGPLDRASAFALLREDMVEGCARANLVARALASAAGWGIDAAEATAVRESNAAYLAELAAPCGVVTATLIDDFQRHPERAAAAAGHRDPAAALALPWYLDVALGSGAPGAVPTAVAVVAGQKSPYGALRWHNEPDRLDAIRAMLKARAPSATIGDLWLEFAIARLFMGARDDGVHFPETAFAGSAGRVRFDWNVGYASLPRRLSPERPIEPTGATYVWIDLRGAPANARLVFRAEWEPPVPFRWALVRVAEDGSEASRVLVTPQQKATSAEKTLDALEGLSGVAVVGVNVGDLALDDPFDPDHAPYEPHGYVLTIASAPP